MKYIYILITILLAIISGIMMYNHWYFFGIFILLISIANVVNLFDIIDNNKETKLKK
jgi:hypothetical protein